MSGTIGNLPTFFGLLPKATEQPMPLYRMVPYCCVMSGSIGNLPTFFGLLPKAQPMPLYRMVPYCWQDANCTLKNVLIFSPEQCGTFLQSVVEPFCRV